MDLAERFWDKVDSSGGPEACWLWTAGTFRSGYGSIGLGGRKAGCGRAHRVSYELNVGPIPRGLHVMHLCDVPRCVNPRHLRLGTHAENQADKAAKGRASRGTASGNARLTDDAVRELRRLRVAGASYPELGRRFAIHKSTARLVALGRRWRHVV